MNKKEEKSRGRKDIKGERKKRGGKREREREREERIGEKSD